MLSGKGPAAGIIAPLAISAFASMYGKQLGGGGGQMLGMLGNLGGALGGGMAGGMGGGADAAGMGSSVMDSATPTVGGIPTMGGMDAGNISGPPPAAPPIGDPMQDMMGMSMDTDMMAPPPPPPLASQTVQPPPPPQLGPQTTLPPSASVGPPPSATAGTNMQPPKEQPDYFSQMMKAMDKQMKYNLAIKGAGAAVSGIGAALKGPSGPSNAGGGYQAPASRTGGLARNRRVGQRQRSRQEYAQQMQGSLGVRKQSGGIG